MRYGQKHFYTQLKCMSLPFLPYLSQILTKLLKTLTSLQKVKVSIHICNLCEVILSSFGTINFTTKDRLQLVWTGFFRVVDQLGLVFKGLVAVLEYLTWSRPVASCLVLRKKTGLNWTQKHYPQPSAAYPAALLMQTLAIAGPSTPLLNSEDILMSPAWNPSSHTPCHGNDVSYVSDSKSINIY